MHKGPLIYFKKLDVGARHEDRAVQDIVPDELVVLHDGTPAIDADPGDRSPLVVLAAQLQQDGLNKPAGLGRLCRSRPMAQDGTVHRERERERDTHTVGRVG